MRSMGMAWLGAALLALLVGCQPAPGDTSVDGGPGGDGGSGGEIGRAHV